MKKLTPKGVWLGHRLFSQAEKFQCFDWNKQFACPTREEALKSLVARRKRQASIYQARANAAEHVIEQVELRRKYLMDLKGY